MAALGVNWLCQPRKSLPGSFEHLGKLGQKLQVVQEFQSKDCENSKVRKSFLILKNLSTRKALKKLFKNKTLNFLFFISSSEERIDCFVVNVAPVRSHIEYIARSFWETLSISLRSSILEDNSTLHEYITTALNTLQHIPSEETGIISASFKYEKIVEDLPRVRNWIFNKSLTKSQVQFSQMTELLKNVQSKNTCLAGWCKETVGSLDSLIAKWEKLLPLIENHHVLLQGQLEVIKGSLLGKINNLNDDAEKFLIKWEDTLKDLEANADSDFEIFRERKRQWEEFVGRRDNLM